MRKPSRTLGVGFPYLASQTAAMRELTEVVDLFELVPDVLCSEQIRDGRSKLTYRTDALDEALHIVSEHPVVVHGLGLSIGTIEAWNEDYLAILGKLQDHRQFEWHSEHLAFMNSIDASGEPIHTGIPLPLPFTQKAAALVAARARVIQSRFGVPFLLENTAYYVPDLPADEGWDEIRFLNEVTTQGNCWLLLDLYNYFCNCRNHDVDPINSLTHLRLDRVVEIHIAGGGTHDGFFVDIHSQPVSDEVWTLLEYVIPRTPALRGIVYELLDDALPALGVPAVTRQIKQARKLLCKGQSSWH